MTYDPELPGCFGEAGLIFALHELDRSQAFAWLIKLRERQTLWTDVAAQIEVYLRERGAGVFHVIDQIDKAQQMLGPWLYGRADTK